ncbi:tyrosine-type recombinase/integrase [Aeoliella sp.]|uniref:tyrosine-type recombinase/integrase n=1 Tax=Aeoliella sp. TaxID=2795800 RepID=UPI003CCC24E8
MTETVNVHVLKRAGRNVWLMRYLDPYTKKHVTKSSGHIKRKDAEKAAGVWQEQLRSGTYIPTSRATWSDAIERYKVVVLPTLGKETATTYLATFNVFEKLATPERLSDLTTNRITRFVTDCREDELSEATIARHLRVLRLFSRWCHGQGMLNRLPKIEIPKRAKGSKRMKGRPISLQEFNEMLLKVPQALEDDPKVKSSADSVRFYLKGLWCSGLRLSESLKLRWDDAPGALVVDFSGKHALLRIPGESQKSGKDQVLPIVPEFVRLLETVPTEQRIGHVFDMPRDRHLTGRFVSSIGKLAKVVVNPKTKKAASAHDLRRSFGDRWSRKVMPAVLKELMRHSDIRTTLEFYVSDDAERTAAELWAADSDLGVRSGVRCEKEEQEAQKNPFE